jgi:hypothetical protein
VTDSPRPLPRLAGIEILRFASAMDVLLRHYDHFTMALNIPIEQVIHSKRFFTLLQPLMIYGYLGV